MFRFDDNDLSLLTTKERVGYSFECYIQQLLWFKFHIPFNGNPLSPLLWKHCIAKGVDVETDNLAMELKFVQHIVYPCHIKKHVIPRFDGIEGKKKVALTNNKSLWTEEAKRLLTAGNISLWDVNDVVNYYSMPSFISIYNFVRRDVEGTILLNEYNAGNILFDEYDVKNNAETNGKMEENSSLNGKEEGKEKTTVRRRNPTKEKKIFKRKCHRCGTTFLTNYVVSTCPNCRKKKDKKSRYWYASVEHYIRRKGDVPRCYYCKAPIKILDEYVRVGISRCILYHKDCWLKLPNGSGPKETITVLINGKEITEVV